MLFIPYSKESFLQDILRIALILQENGKGRIAVVTAEDDTKPIPNPNNKTFFKIRGDLNAWYI